MSKLIALDATARTIDKDGRMHIDRSHIAKVGVNPYYGREIPGADMLGLDLDQVYYLFRSAEELEKAAPTFARNQLLSKHVPVTLYETMGEQEKKKLIVGTVGSDIQFEDPYVDADICIWDANAIAGIETDTVRELSPAYHYKPIMIAGEYKGQKYDGLMTDIRGNHLCLVEAGRQGPDVLAADTKLREPMKTTKLGKVLITTLGTAYPKLALDAAFAPLLAKATKKNFDRAGIRAKLIAMDDDMPPAEMDAVMDAVLDMEEKEPEAKKPAAEPAEDDDEDETDEEKAARMKKEKKAADKAAKDEAKKAEDEEAEKKSDEKVKTAMDALRADLHDADEARRAVRPVVGEVIAQDSAEEIYGFALDEMKVDRKGVTGVTNLRALFNLAHSKSATPAPRIAQDSAGLHEMFPGAARIKHA